LLPSCFWPETCRKFRFSRHCAVINYVHQLQSKQKAGCISVVATAAEAPQAAKAKATATAEKPKHCGTLESQFISKLKINRRAERSETFPRHSSGQRCV